MSRIVLLSALLTIVAAPAAQADRRFAGERQTYTDYARVTNVEPIYTRVAYEKPQRECWLEESHHTTVYEGRSTDRRNRRQVGDTLAGGVIGGVIGNQLGRHGSDGARIGATVVGAIIGSAIAGEKSDHQRRHRRPEPQPHYSREYTRGQPVERCTTKVSTEYRREISAYQVTYRYRGNTFTTRTDTDPGDRIPVRISIQPVNG